MRLIYSLFLGLLLNLSPSVFGKGANETSSPFLTLLPAYIEIQKSLAQDNLTQLTELGVKFKKSLETLLKGELNESEETEMKNLLSSVTQFTDSKNGAEYRINFGNISKVFITHLKSHKTETKGLQLFFCPMFPQGYAFWFQKKPEVLANPYWGKEMLSCGVKRPW
jgi:hypothetical protein